MKQKEVSKWLKGITIVLAVMGAFFFGLIVPILAKEMKDGYPEVAFLYGPGLIYSFLIAVLCYIILFNFWKVTCEIGRDNSFSKENAVSFKRISRIALLLSVIWFAGILFLGINMWLNPGILILMVMAVMISIIISIMAAALSHLIWNAYELKKENELTI